MRDNTHAFLKQKLFAPRPIVITAHEAKVHILIVNGLAHVFAPACLHLKFHQRILLLEQLQKPWQLVAGKVVGYNVSA